MYPAHLRICSNPTDLSLWSMTCPSFKRFVPRNGTKHLLDERTWYFLNFYIHVVVILPVVYHGGTRDPPVGGMKSIMLNSR